MTAPSWGEFFVLLAQDLITLACALGLIVGAWCSIPLVRRTPLIRWPKAMEDTEMCGTCVHPAEDHDEGTGICYSCPGRDICPDVPGRRNPGWNPGFAEQRCRRCGLTMGRHPLVSSNRIVCPIDR